LASFLKLVRPGLSKSLTPSPKAKRRFYAKMLAVLALSGLAVSASAADIEAGKAKAASCAGCHGADGIAVNPAYPNLAGQNA
jgi:cytochrome c553